MEGPWFWVGFNAFILFMLLLDLGIFHRKERSVSIKESLLWTAFWIGLAMSFMGLVYAYRGGESALEFLTGYLIEESLSVDNLFVFLVIFNYFGVSRYNQHKVLFWGILSALVMRAFFIVAGVAWLNRFHWIIYVFGAILVFTAIRLLLAGEEPYDPESNPMLKFIRKFVPVTKEYVGNNFFTTVDGKLFGTPLLVVLFAVETTDLLFAVDSIPAVIAISKDPFIVYTSNAFAILGLRSIYFALAGTMELFQYLRYGLAAILGFVGVKMLISGHYHIPIQVALGVVAGILIISVVASLVETHWLRRKSGGATPGESPTATE